MHGGRTRVRRGLVLGCFSGTVIELVNSVFNLLASQSTNVRSYGEVLLQEAVGVLVESSLSGTVGIAEIDLAGQILFQFLMACELGAVFGRQSADQLPPPGEVPADGNSQIG
jgi:hypothetical protein